MTPESAPVLPMIKAGIPVGTSTLIGPQIALAPGALRAGRARFVAILVAIPAFVLMAVLALVCGVVGGLYLVVLRILGCMDGWRARRLVRTRARRGLEYPAVFASPLQAAPRMVLANVGNARIATLFGWIACVPPAVVGPVVFPLSWMKGRKVFARRLERLAARGVVPHDVALPSSRTYQATLRAVISGVQGFRSTLLDDGADEAVSRYDRWLKRMSPPLAGFRRIWIKKGADPRTFEFNPPAKTKTSDHVSPIVDASIRKYPDPFGFPGLASAAIRRNEIRSLRGLYLSAREIDDMCDPNLEDRPTAAVVRIIRSELPINGESEGKESAWIVQIASTQSWDPRAGACANDVTADLHAAAGLETCLLRGTLAAMDNYRVGPNDPLLVTGFSLGGLIAAQLATGQFVRPKSGLRVVPTHLVVAGSPIGRFPIAPEVRVLSIEHILDPVHRLDGRPKYGTSQYPNWLTATAGPPLPLDYHIAATHHAPSYGETGEAVPTLAGAKALWEGSPDMHGLRRFFMGVQRIQDFAVERVIAPSGGVIEPIPSQHAVPVYFQAKSGDGISRGRLRAFLRRIKGVIAADVFLSRSGFPSTKTWSADVLVDSLDDWVGPDRRQFAYGTLLSLVENQSSVAVSLRLASHNQPFCNVNAEIRQVDATTWRESLDIDGSGYAPDFQPMPGGIEITTAGVNRHNLGASRVFEYSADPFGEFRNLIDLI